VIFGPTQFARSHVAATLLTLILMAVISVPAVVHAQGCSLNSAGGKIRHVIYIQFDDVHFRRDNSNVRPAQ
jgi:hypothetical protein